MRQPRDSRFGKLSFRHVIDHAQNVKRLIALIAKRDTARKDHALFAAAGRNLTLVKYRPRRTQQLLVARLYS
jgi:hypothetical protein